MDGQKKVSLMGIDGVGQAIRVVNTIMGDSVQPSMGMLLPFIWVRLQFLDQSWTIKVYYIGSQLGEVTIDQSWQSRVQPELGLLERVKPFLSSVQEGYDGNPCLCKEQVVQTL